MSKRAANKIVDGLLQALGYQQGVNAERAAIVAWLRLMARSTDTVPDELDAAVWREIATAIESGAHLPQAKAEGDA